MIGPQTTIRLINTVVEREAATLVNAPAWMAWAHICETIAEESPDDPCSTGAVWIGDEITIYFHPTRSDEEFLRAMEAEVEREEAEAAEGGVN